MNCISKHVVKVPGTARLPNGVMGSVYAGPAPTGNVRGNLEQTIAELGQAFDEFRAGYGGRLADIEHQITHIETAQARPRFGGGGEAEPEAEAARRFMASATGRPIAQVAAPPLDEYRLYKEAFDSYLRRGEAALSGDLRNALSVGSDPDGGFLAPAEQSGIIATRLFELSPIRQIAQVIETGSSDALEGIIDNAEPADGGWVGERQPRPETAAPPIAKSRIPLNDQYANPKMTQRLLDDPGFDTAGWLEQKIGKKLARTEGAAFVNGDGVTKPTGFLHYGAAATTEADSARAWGVLQYIPTGAAGAFDGTNPADVLFDTLFSLKPDYLPNAVWVMSRSTMAAIAKIKDGQGNYLLTLGTLAGQVGMLLLGHRVVLAEDMPAIAGNSLSIAFGDFMAGYLIVDHRKGLTILRDPFTNKPFVHFYATRSVGADVVDFDAIKLVKFAAS